VAEFIADEEVSVGKYILTGGELPAMIIVDSISRLIKGVLGNKDSLVSESYNNQIVKSKRNNEKSKCNEGKTLDYPVYTRPAEFNDWEVPSILQSGNHKEIEKWRKKRR
jgi:tRNA (guanine37-N1)-methyltransferase